MTTIAKPPTKKTWSKALSQPAKEFPLTPLPIVRGKIPPGLRGTLYRNGPGRLERGGIRVGHWFDGDGAILAVQFTDQGATGVYRYVQTTGYLAETKAGKLLYGNYGMNAPGPFWNQWLRPLKNAANTSVLALPDKLLALWEGGNPYSLNLQTLETRGLDNLDGLDQGTPYSAHPKCDPETGEIFNFGVTPGINAKLNLFKSDRTGKIIQKSSFILHGFPVVHDFVMAGQYLVFFIPPVRINLLPIAIGLSSFSNGMEWKPQLGTQILIFDRETLSLVSRNETEPWYQWHFSNGYLNDHHSVTIDFIHYRDFQTNQRLKEIATGQTQTPAKSTLWQIHLDPKTAKVKATQELLDRDCEFPIVPPARVGKPSRSTYLSLHRQRVDTTSEVYGAIAHFDNQTATLTEADLGENRYPSEPIYAPDLLTPERGWILTVVFDGNTESSEVWIFDSQKLDEEPVCKLALPNVIPMSFHGSWKPK